MQAVIRIIGLAGGGLSILDGRYLADYDPNANNGRGAIRTTRDKRRALRFPTAREALQCWRAPAAPPYHLRGDGQPNRPLTAFTIEVVQLDREGAAA